MGRTPSVRGPVAESRRLSAEQDGQVFTLIDLALCREDRQEVTSSPTSNLMVVTSVIKERHFIRGVSDLSAFLLERAYVCVALPGDIWVEF